MKKLLITPLSLLVLVSCSEVNVPGVGKIISLSCYCDSEFNKSAQIEKECYYEDRKWILSTIAESFSENGREYKGNFFVTNKFYKVVVPEEENTGEVTITLDRNSLKLIKENYRYIDTYSCTIGEPKV